MKYLQKGDAVSRGLKHSKHGREIDEFLTHSEFLRAFDALLCLLLALPETHTDQCQGNIFSMCFRFFGFYLFILRVRARESTQGEEAERERERDRERERERIPSSL